MNCFTITVILAAIFCASSAESVDHHDADHIVPEGDMDGIHAVSFTAKSYLIAVLARSVPLQRAP